MKNRYFKILIFILTIFLSLVTICFGQAKESNQELISFSNIKDSYATEQPIEFYIQNNDKKPLSFYCSMEKKIDDQWREIILSIQEVKMSKSVRLWKIVPNEKCKLILDPNKKAFKILKSLIDSGNFRFRLEVFDVTGKDYQTKIYSKEFVIK